MAINTTIPNFSPFAAFNGMATKLLANVFTPPISLGGDVISCDYITMPYSEIVFADLSGDWWKNDKSEFLYKKYISADTIDIELWKDDEKIADLDDNALGTYFSTFTQQPLYKGYLVDWNLVYAFSGAGNYTIKAQTVILGQSIEVVSRTFTLMLYSKEAAHNTVRIESVQNGNIIGNEFDFTNLNWYQSIRVGGTFGNPRPIYSTDNYVAENRTIEQNQARMTREFDMTLRPIPFEIVEKIIYNKVLANSILITDYNIFAEKEWLRLPVVLKEVSKRDIQNVQNQMYDLQFTDNKDFYIKRNY
jgi:hypothetical protein